MTNQQILEKAIRKAIDGGWLNLRGEVEIVEVYVKNKGYTSYEVGDEVFGSLEQLVFNHDFAKALWGEREATIQFWDSPEQLGEPDHSLKLPAWRKHLVFMVLAEDPIKYLGEHLDG